MSYHDFNGWFHRQLDMPDGGRIVCFYYRNECGKVSLHDINHNIFRLNAQGEVVWQVRREEKDELTLEQVNKNWQAIGQGEWREPFMGFGLVHSDGRTESGDSLVWQPGCVVKVVSSIGHDYELDVEQGLIVNLTPGQRPW